MPVSPSSTMSGIPPTRLPTTPRPRQNASTTTRPRPSERDGSTRTVASSSARATSGVDNDSAHRVCAGRSATSRSATSRSVPRPTRWSLASGTRGAARRQASASTSTALYRSRTPTNRATGSSDSGTGSRSTNGSRSMNAANSAVGSTPAARTSPDVYAEIVRTPSLLRSPRRASASASGASALRHDDP